MLVCCFLDCLCCERSSSTGNTKSIYWASLIVSRFIFFAVIKLWPLPLPPCLKPHNMKSEIRDLINNSLILRSSIDEFLPVFDRFLAFSFVGGVRGGSKTSLFVVVWSLSVVLAMVKMNLDLQLQRNRRGSFTHKTSPEQPFHQES